MQGQDRCFPPGLVLPRGLPPRSGPAPSPAPVKFVLHKNLRIVDYGLGTKQLLVCLCCGGCSQMPRPDETEHLGIIGAFQRRHSECMPGPVLSMNETRWLKKALLAVNLL